MDDQGRGWLLHPFDEGDIVPGGWLRTQMQEDLRSGVVGWLDHLAPDLVVEDDIFGRDRLTRSSTRKDLGAVLPGPAWEPQLQWWNAETQGNWRDGWVHHALWVGDERDRAAVGVWVERILAGSDADGYLGIHAPDSRFPQTGENGELWGQTVLLRALLGQYRHTGHPETLSAVRRAVQRTMRGYPPGASRPFGGRGGAAGVSHGLMFTDVLRELAHLTEEPAYSLYAGWLYRAYAEATGLEGDAQVRALLAAGRGFGRHGVHTYEHWRALTTAAMDAGAPRSSDPGATLDSRTLQALDAAYLAKLADALTPTGAPNGDEDCHPVGSADETGYELCSVQELLHGYGVRLQATGDVSIGDQMESLVLNVGFGMRDPHSASVSYLTTDNRRSLTGPAATGQDIAGAKPETRYRYSPLHREAAVCCVPNWGRLLPTYCRYQWLRGKLNGSPLILALLFGASELRAEVAGTRVQILQATAFPHGADIEFTVRVDGEAEFTLGVRRPGWSGRATVDGVAAGRVHEGESLIRILGPWSGTASLRVSFSAQPALEPSKGARLVTRGPLLYALPLVGERVVTRAYPLPAPGVRFADVEVRPSGGSGAIRLVDTPSIELAGAPVPSEAAQAPHAWQRQALVVPMVGPDGSVGDRVLVPMGATSLRVAVFS